MKVASGDSAGALEDLATYVPAHLADTDAARLLGDLYFRLPDFAHAEATWNAIVARHADDIETHARLGRLFAAEGRVNAAIREFEQSLPSRIGFSGLVDEHHRRGDLIEFVNVYARYADDNRLNATAQSLYANVLHALLRFDRAQIYFERSAALEPGNCAALTDAGNNLIDLNRLADALRFLNRCLTIDPTNYAANVDAGDAYIDGNATDKALESFDSALVTEPTGSEALVDVGYIEDDRGHWNSAVAYYLRAIDADPLEAAAYIDLGFDYKNHHFYALAESAFLKGLAIAPNDGRLHYLLAVTYNVQGKVDLARAQYRLALASDEPMVVQAARAELTQLPQPL